MSEPRKEVHFAFSNFKPLLTILLKLYTGMDLDTFRLVHGGALRALKSGPANLSNPLSIIHGIMTFLFVPTSFLDNSSFSKTF